MTSTAAALRAEVEEAVLDEVERVGAAFSRSAVVRRFLGRGTAQSSLFRWIEAVVASGKPGQHVARIVKEAAAERAARVSDPAADVAAAIAGKLPTICITDEELTGVVRIIAKLREIVRDTDLLISHAKAADGGVRNARLLLTANAEMRKTLETALRMQQAMHSAQQIDKMHEAVIDEVAKLAPETAEAILRRIDQLLARWDI